MTIMPYHIKINENLYKSNSIFSMKYLEIFDHINACNTELHTKFLFNNIPLLSI